MIVNNSLFPAKFSFRAISDMRDQLDKLNQQLATGQRAQSLSELGADRVVDMTLRARIASLGTYQQNLDNVDVRLNYLDDVMKRIDEIEDNTRSSAQQGSFEINGVNMTAAQYLAENRMKEVVDLLNADLNGRHLLAGNATENDPVPSYDALMNGADGKDGFRTIMSQRRDADLGASGQGRMTNGVVGSTVSIAEDGAHPFGFKLDSLSSDGSSTTLTGPSGAPGSASIEFTSQPADNERIMIGLDLPDGTTFTLELKAVAGAPQSPNEFQIGGSTADTAAYMQAALNERLGYYADTKLSAASAYAAAEDFFNSNGEPAMRVDGPPYDSATALVAATDADTVIWYQGESATNPRLTSRARVDESTRVNYGVQANEKGFATLMQSLAVFAAEGFPASDPNSSARYEAMNSVVRQRLAETNNSQKGSIEVVQMELGLAKTSAARVAERHGQQKATLESMLSEIESVSMEEVAVQIMQLKTRMEASYQTTSIVNQLSMVNYMR
ncbi:flagellin N-terminal helical domain-containing protein [Maritalea mediterranea]|uniref:Flagellin N-terminal domain-containing protein n=1 Tax=Maritalea mediterranea TaxID=2909667 RepID=A0ABS9E7R1_9HYPH|nr:hypothetical protein [Maritalea mediterranea]MCF4098833.1 hypothetical protein [Maritalea mediterranea]